MLVVRLKLGREWDLGCMTALGVVSASTHPQWWLPCHSGGGQQELSGHAHAGPVTSLTCLLAAVLPGACRLC